jgi:hypothetical protein
MPGRKRRASATDLARATERFKQLRRARVSRTRIPLALWKEAVNVAGRHEVARTATALKLDSYALKNRLLLQPVLVAAPDRSSPPAQAAVRSRDGEDSGRDGPDRRVDITRQSR